MVAAIAVMERAMRLTSTMVYGAAALTAAGLCASQAAARSGSQGMGPEASARIRVSVSVAPRFEVAVQAGRPPQVSSNTPGLPYRLVSVAPDPPLPAGGAGAEPGQPGPRLVLIVPE